MDDSSLDFTITELGPKTISSPIVLSREMHDFVANYVMDHQYVISDIEVSSEEMSPQQSLEKTYTKQHLLQRAGAREKIFFDPSSTHAAVVTCGGLCPGLNDVIRSIVMTLWYRYGVRRISGVRFGYRGLLPEFGLPMMNLTPDQVADVHREGGTLLGSSRGYGDRTSELVDALEEMKVNAFFAVGGDGTQRGALRISEEIQRRGGKLAVIGIPKTIDNDLSFVQRSFGFESAVDKAVDAVAAAHVEAHDAPNGVGLVKVMGRESGFIAAHTALAINDVNFVLIPEVPFELHGEAGLFVNLERRLRSRGHAVVLVAEGAGQGLMDTEGTDASGNRKLGDIGLFLKSEISKFFAEKGIELNLKYIDPSYMIRSAPANASDSLYCARLGSNAAHAAMAGKTNMVVSLMNNHMVHVPIEMAVRRKNRVDPESSLWRDVMDATGQPALMRN